MHSLKLSEEILSNDQLNDLPWPEEAQRAVVREIGTEGLLVHLLLASGFPPEFCDQRVHRRNSLCPPLEMLCLCGCLPRYLSKPVLILFEPDRWSRSPSHYQAIFLERGGRGRQVFGSHDDRRFLWRRG